MPFTLITITGAFTRPSGQPAQGRLTAILSEPIRNATSAIDATPVYGILNAAGQLKDEGGLSPLTLEANDDPATLPAGSHYQFTLALDSAPVQEFAAVIPHLAPAGTIDLSALV